MNQRGFDKNIDWFQNKVQLSVGSLSKASSAAGTLSHMEERGDGLFQRMIEAMRK